MKVTPLSRAELLALAPSTDLRTLGRAFGVSEPVARERQRQGEWQRLGIRVNRLGAQYRVVSADILNALGIDPNVTAAGLAGPAAIEDDQSGGYQELSHGQRTVRA